MKYKAVDFDKFSLNCPYGCMSLSNNGYGCNHPQQTEKAVHDGLTEGLCYCFSCPLGCEAEQEDWDDEEYRKDIDWSDYFDENDDEVEIGECEFLIIEKKVLEEIEKGGK